MARRAADIGPPMVGLVALVAVTAWGLWRRPALGFLGAWFFIILAPTSSIVPIADLAFEHRMYLPLAGVVVLTVIVAHHLITIVARRSPSAEYPSHRPAAGLVIVAVALLGYATIQRNKDYHSALTMWGDVVEKRPQSARGRANLARSLINEGRLTETIEQCHEALRVSPGSAKAYLNLGLALKGQRRFKEAIEQYGNALRCKPDLADAHVGLVEPLLALGRIDEAVEHGTRAVRLKSRDARARNNLGLALWRAGRIDDALKHYNRALRLQPDLLEGHHNLGLLLAGQGKYEEAIQSYRQVVRINPRYAEAHYNRGVVLARQCRPDEAVKKYQDALRADLNQRMARRQLEIINKRQEHSTTP